MKVCFINPPIQDFYITNIRRQPLGILYLISALEHDSSVTIEIINGHNFNKKILPLPDAFNYLQEFIQNKSFPFTNYYHFGLSFQEIKQQIMQKQADVYCISSLFTCYSKEVEIICQIIRKVSPDSYIVTGGYHATLHSRNILRKGLVDYIIKGEAENALNQLIQMLKTFKINEAEIPGLVFKNGNQIIENNPIISPIDSIAIPNRKVLKNRDFKMYKNRMVSMITSRGCPNNCRFCTSKSFWGPYRTRSIDNILEEISYCYSTFDINVFNFEDDNIFPNKNSAKLLLNALIQHKKKTGMQCEFTAMNGISIEQLDEEIVSLMQKAGFKEINISLVTHDKKIQQIEKRPFNSETFSKIITYAKQLSFNIRAYFILGLPGQSKEEINETIQFLINHNVLFFPSVYYNVNSPEQEWVMQRSSAFFNESEYLSRKDLIYLFGKCRTNV